MTTIDRAAIERELRQFAADVVRTNKVTSDGHDAAAVVLREAVDRIAALRQPDQNGEAVGASELVEELQHCLDSSRTRGLITVALTPSRVEDIIWRLATPQPTPEAGKLPSEEAFKQCLASLVAAVSLLRRAQDDAVQPAFATPSLKMFKAMLADYEKAIEQGRAALLSPAQPHDVAAGDGLVARLRAAEACGDQRCRAMEARSGCICAEAADALEAQGRRIAELSGALDECAEALSTCYNVCDWPADGSTSQDAALRRARSTSGRA